MLYFYHYFIIIIIGEEPGGVTQPFWGLGYIVDYSDLTDQKQWIDAKVPQIKSGLDMNSYLPRMVVVNGSWRLEWLISKGGWGPKKPVLEEHSVDFEHTD